MDDLHKTFQTLIRKIHGPNLPEALEDKMIIDILLQLEQAWVKAVFNDLSPDQQAELQALLAQNNPAQVQQFIHNVVPDSAKKLEQATTDLIQDYITVCQSV